MRLNKEEKEMLRGQRGEGCKLAMEILTEIGEAYSAPRLIPVRSAHIVLSAYKTMFDAGVEVLEKFASLQAKATIPTTIDPAGMDLDRWQEFRIPQEYAVKQWRVVAAARALDFIPCWTCTPYLCGLLPREGDHLAWTESAAVVFANSILGARTNREGAVVDVAASIAGRTPYHGLHLDENRRGQMLIDVKIKDFTPEKYIILGYFMGQQAGTRIPVLIGLKATSRFESYQTMGAASAASGGVALYHIVGVTPEAKTLEKAFGKNPIPKPIQFGTKELKETKIKMCTASPGPIDAVLVGCPHYTITEIRELVSLLNGRHIHRDVKFWIYTFKNTILMAERLGYKEIIEKAGADLVSDTCMIVSPIDIYGFRRVMTDSGKSCYYAPAQTNADVIFGSTQECVDAAVSGEWNGLND